MRSMRKRRAAIAAYATAATVFRGVLIRSLALAGELDLQVVCVQASY